MENTPLNTAFSLLRSDLDDLLSEAQVNLKRIQETLEQIRILLNDSSIDKAPNDTILF